MCVHVGLFVLCVAYCVDVHLCTLYAFVRISLMCSMCLNVCLLVCAFMCVDVREYVVISCVCAFIGVYGIFEGPCMRVHVHLCSSMCINARFVRLCVFMCVCDFTSACSSVFQH